MTYKFSPATNDPNLQNYINRDYQYDWNDQSEWNETTKQGLQLINQLDRPDNPIKDVYLNGRKVGAFNTETGTKYGLTNPGKIATYNQIQNSLSNNNTIVNSGDNQATAGSRNYISPEDVAKMNPDNAKTGRIAGALAGGLTGGVGGAIGGGIGGATVGGPVGFIGGGLAGTTAGTMTGMTLGEKVGGEIEYALKGLNDNRRIVENKQYISSEDVKRMNPSNTGRYVGAAAGGILGGIGGGMIGGLGTAGIGAPAGIGIGSSAGLGLGSVIGSEIEYYLKGLGEKKVTTGNNSILQPQKKTYISPDDVDKMNQQQSASFQRPSFWNKEDWEY